MSPLLVSFFHVVFCIFFFCISPQFFFPFGFFFLSMPLAPLEIKYCGIKGDMNLTERSEIQNKFNDEQNEMPLIMLLSLKAGGVGLNIVGANRMFLLDFHWII